MPSSPPPSRSPLSSQRRGNLRLEGRAVGGWGMTRLWFPRNPGRANSSSWAEVLRTWVIRGERRDWAWKPSLSPVASKCRRSMAYGIWIVYRNIGNDGLKPSVHHPAVGCVPTEVRFVSVRMASMALLVILLASGSGNGQGQEEHL